MSCKIQYQDKTFDTADQLFDYARRNNIQEILSVIDNNVLDNSNIFEDENRQSDKGGDLEASDNGAENRVVENASKLLSTPIREAIKTLEQGGGVLFGYFQKNPSRSSLASGVWNHSSADRVFRNNSRDRALFNEYLNEGKTLQDALGDPKAGATFKAFVLSLLCTQAFEPSQQLGRVLQHLKEAISHRRGLNVEKDGGIRAEDVQVVINTNINSNDFHYNPKENLIVIGFGRLMTLGGGGRFNNIQEYTSYLPKALEEELIHAVAGNILSRDEIQAIYNEMGESLKDEVIKAYRGNPNAKSDDIEPVNIVHEYLRQVVQRITTGTTTKEAEFSITGKVLSALRKIVDFIINAVKGKPLALEATQKIKDFIEGKNIPIITDRATGDNIREFSEEENKLFNSFDKRIEQYGIQKIEDKPTDDESESTSYYIKKGPDGKETKIRRVTEVAKAKNKARNGGVDYFANATQEQKEQWARKAMAGTDGHKLLEDVTKAALNEDGTVKAKDDIDLSNITTGLNSKIAKLLTDYLLGSDTQVGLLYTFPAGTRFKTEQIIYSDKDNLAGTTDLLAFKPDGTVEVLDYKFMGFDTDKNIDIPVQKRQQHAIQLGEYKKILSTYGIKPSQITARTIPIHAQYSSVQVVEDGKKKWLPVLGGITLGNVNMRDEERTYLLSVVPDDQSTGNTRADDLVKSLKSWYKKLYNRKTDDHGRELKNEELNTLSAAIRNIQTALNFDPLAEQASQYVKTTQKIIDNANTNLDTISLEDRDKLLQELMSAYYVSENYADIDRIFKDAYGEEEELTDKQKGTLDKLRKASDAAKSKRDSLLEQIKKIIIFDAEKEGIHGIDKAEIEINSYIKDTREGGSQQPKAIQLYSTLYARAISKSKIKYVHEAEEYSKIYDEAEKSVGGKNPFDFIAVKDGHELISETEGLFGKNGKLSEATKNRDVKWLKENVDIEQYNKLYGEHLKLYQQDLERVSDNTEENLRRLNNWKKKFDINDPNFFGFDNWIVKKTLRKDKWESKEFQKLKENAPLYALWKYWNDLNKRAFSSGYLERGNTTRFLPFLLGTTIERIFGGDNSIKALTGSIADRFSVTADEDLKHAAIDEETGEQKKTIPKYYTHDLSIKIKDENGNVIKKDYSNLSRDLRKMGLTYIYALNRYEAMQALENEAEAIKLVEESKGHLELQRGKVIMRNDNTPRVFKGNEKNTDVLQEYIDDGLYGIHYDRNSLGDKLLGSLNIGEDKKLSTMKGLQQTHKLLHLQALSLKTLVALPNAIGGYMQSIINSGRYFTKGEFRKSLFETIGSVFPQGEKGEIEKGLIDYLVPINEDFVKHISRKEARTPLSKLKYWSMSDLLMSTLSIPDKVIQISNARAFIKNTMVENGRLINIREYLRQQPEWQERYRNGTVKSVEKDFNKKVKEFQETRSLSKIAFYNKEGILEIQGIDYNSDSVADLRNRIIQVSKNALGFMPEESRRLYTRDIIKNSFAMFKHWMLPHTEQRFAGLKYSKIQDAWVYGRMRLAAKIIVQRKLKSFGTMKNILTANEKGLEFLHELWEQKKDEYFKKTGVELSEEMTEEQFYDMVRSTLKQEAQELKMLAGLLCLLLWAKAATPPDDDEDKNKFKIAARAISKTSDELLFYYDPTSAESITRGSLIPAMGILSQLKRVMTHGSRLIIGEVRGDEDMIQKANLTKSIISILPVGTFFETEVLPIIDPEMAKELGIVVTTQARPAQ